MVHSIELLFDRETEAALRRIWDELADADLPCRIPPGRPHVTVSVAKRIDPDVDDLLRGVLQQLPLACVIGAPLLFGRSDPVLTRLVVPSSGLLDLHAEIQRLCGPHLVPGPLPHTLPGHWTPHITLARRVDAVYLGPAVTIANRPVDLAGKFAGLRRWDGDERVEYPIG